MRAARFEKAKTRFEEKSRIGTSGWRARLSQLANASRVGEAEGDQQAAGR